jgi:hypothetical protein
VGRTAKLLGISEDVLRSELAALLQDGQGALASSKANGASRAERDDDAPPPHRAPASRPKASKAPPPKAKGKKR